MISKSQALIGMGVLFTGAGGSQSGTGPHVRNLKMDPTSIYCPIAILVQ